MRFDVWDFTPNTSIPPGGTLSFKVDYSPTQVGETAASITINSNEPDEGTFTFGVKGLGIEPQEVPLGSPVQLLVFMLVLLMFGNRIIRRGIS